MSKIPLSQIPDKTRDRLFPVVLALFSENDFHRVKMRTIAQQSGVSVSNIYKYFSSKEDLLFRLLEERICDIFDLIRTHVKGIKSGKEIFRKILWISMDYYDHNPEFAITAFITVPTRTWMGQDTFPIRKLKIFFEELIEELKSREEIDPSIDARLSQDIYYMVCYRVIYTWYYFGRRWKLVDAIDRDFDIFWKMLERRICHLGLRECPVSGKLTYASADGVVK